MSRAPGSGPRYGTRAPGLSGLPALRNGTTARCQGSAQENASASLLSVHRSHVGAVTSSTRLLRSLRGRPPTSGARSESVCDGPPENVVWKARSRGTTPEADGASAVHQGCGDKAARSPASGPPRGPGVLLQATLQGVGCTGSRPSACPRACPRRWLSACGRRPCLLRGQVRFSGDQWTGAQAVSLRQAAAAEGGAEPQLATHPHSARDLRPLPRSADRGGRACKGDSCGLEWAVEFSHSHSEPAFLSPFLEKRGRRCRSARDAAAPAASAFFRPRAALPERAKFTPRSPLNRSERLSRHFTAMTVIR